ncbi:DUF6090 family protein [Litoribaculum gwangyangense]|uniref:Uncharacterized protein n=1 Tax=Litoribaculum gwangyangense TaxID=1130722 RepID=A0ABP9CWI5_9FLAO
MLKFFRKIRQNLVSEGITTKYFKYAIGEIILVVIGILIALQINNWNNAKTQQKNNLQLSKRLLVETKKNLVELEKEITSTEKLISSAFHMLQLIGNDYSDVNPRLVDSLVFDLLSTPTYNFSTAVLKEALSTGEVASFENDSLKNLIYSIPTIMETVKFRENNIEHDTNNNLIPFLYNNTSLREIDNKFSHWKKLGNSQLDQIDNRQILSMILWENEIDNLYYIYNTLLRDSYKVVEKNLINLESLLEKEINTY